MKTEKKRVFLQSKTGFSVLRNIRFFGFGKNLVAIPTCTVWPPFANVTDDRQTNDGRQTDSTLPILITDSWLTSYESAKTI